LACRSPSPRRKVASQPPSLAHPTPRAVKDSGPGRECLQQTIDVDEDRRSSATLKSAGALG
jgi:hypothetical protein